MSHKQATISDLLEEVNLQEEDSYICLTDESLDKFKDLVTEWKHKEVFAKHKLSVRNKILLHGPTGNGKTSVAKFLARKIAWPLYRVRHEQILSSYMGEIAKNIGTLFDELPKDIPCVILFDEIDSVTLSRTLMGGRQTVDEEYNRALNVMLIKMELMPPDVVFIGATNRFDELDTAFVRRIELVHEMPKPDNEAKTLFAQRHINYYNIDILGEPLGTILELESFYEIKQALLNHLRQDILKSIYAKNTATKDKKLEEA